MKKLYLFLVLLLPLFLLAGCSSDSTTGSHAENDDSVFIIGVDDQFPPLGFRDEQGNIVGFDVDLAQEVADRLGQDLVVQQIDWNAKELELQQGNIDAIWNGLSITPERAEQMLFTDPYLENDMIIVVPEGSDITSLSDLAGKTVAVQAGSSALDALESNAVYDEIGEVSEYDDNVSAFQDLKIGRADALAIDSVVARYYVAEDGGGFTFIDESLSPEQYGVAVAKDNKELLDQINKYLNEVKTDGTGAAISEDWFGEDILFIPESSTTTSK